MKARTSDKESGHTNV